ncbi:MAG TPA: ATP-binding cassette domain-containing protein [Roseomonas sp.]|jgi:ATPase subunit of ABC transporter with duplicated ATPase domains
MGTIGLRNLGLLAPAPLFRNLSFTLGDGDRLGIVASNGGGKSSLLRCIAGERAPEEGAVALSRGLRVAHVAQEVPATLLALPMAEAVRRALPPEARAAEAWRVDLALDLFETPAALRATPVAALSGGWQRLALLARAAVTEPDALLLDEPTNHLDLDKLRLLEAWLAGLAIPMVIASHDRQFLDHCTTRTLFLRPGQSRLHALPYGLARAALAETDAAEETRQAKDLREADRLRRSAGALRNIGINSRSDAAQKKAMQMARRAETLEQAAQPPHAERAGDIRLSHRDTHAKVIFALDDVVVRAPDGRALFRTGRLAIAQQDRVLLLGPNGAGKSCFLALLRQALAAPDAVPGLRAAPGLVPGHLDQHMSHLPAAETPLGFISRRFPVGDQHAISLLAAAGFPVEAQRQRIATLSPGQKARLGLLGLRLTEPNLYLLDEPTNHVDIPGQERLEAEILAQRSTCVLISHDRRFAAGIGNRFLLIEAGRLRALENEAEVRRVLLA